MSASPRYPLLLLILSPLLLWGCLTAPFSELDDQLFINQNPALQPDAPWSDVFCRDLDPLYMPLNYLSLRIDRTFIAPLFTGIAGENAWPAAIRAVNLLFHVGVALLVWWLMCGLGLSPGVAAFVTIAFALHPTACHAVCWPIERKSMLAAGFGFAAIGVYMRGSTPKHIAGSALLHVLALLSKPSAFGLLPIVIVWEILGRPTLKETTGPRYSSPREALLKLAPWVVAAAVALWNQVHVLSPVSLPPIGGSLFTVALSDLPVLQRYIINYVWPFRLAAEYGLAGVFSLADSRLWIAVAFLTFVVGGTLYFAGRERRRMVLFGWLWFVGALGPALNFVGKNNLMEDCHAYLSAPAFWMVLGLTLEGVAERLPKLNLGRFAVPSLAVLALALALGSASRSYLFASTEVLFTDAAEKEPAGALSHLILAQLLRRKGDRQFAAGDAAGERVTRDREMHELEAGIAGTNFERSRLVSSSYVWLARAYYEHGRADDAAKQLNNARTSPQGLDRALGSTVLRMKGLIAHDAGNDEQALKFFEGALALTPEQTFLWLDRARSLLALKLKFTQAGNTQGAANCDAGLKQALDAVPAGDPVRSDLYQLMQSHP